MRIPQPLTLKSVCPLPRAARPGGRRRCLSGKGSIQKIGEGCLLSSKVLQRLLQSGECCGTVLSSRQGGVPAETVRENDRAILPPTPFGLCNPRQRCCSMRATSVFQKFFPVAVSLIFVLS